MLLRTQFSISFLIFALLFLLFDLELLPSLPTRTFAIHPPVRLPNRRYRRGFSRPRRQWCYPERD